MQRDTLFLLAPDFTDPAYPGQVFYCTHCALLEFVLAQYAEQLRGLNVVRTQWPRPRQDLIDLLGEANQSLPLLIIGDRTRTDCATGVFQDRYFIQGVDSLMRFLSAHYGIPLPHP